MTTASYILIAIAAHATLGGLIVVIVSVIGYFQIDNKVKAQFQKHCNEHQKKLDEQSATGIPDCGLRLR